ncbi:nuclear transport factor 2 family protein [Streptomyces sp. NPDC014676]|uniref:nuclear transport factor 2 family protein n=1 Tax=Streptomyces sp. NPDC014676 TaxID=3364879 RepID=UPI0036F903A8
MQISQVNPREDEIMAVITLPQTVQNFVTATNAHDSEALFAVFAPGATVVDDGTTYATEADIRGFIKVHLVDPKVVITPISYGAGRMMAPPASEAPGGPLTFAFTFETKDDLITHLSIDVA